MKQHICKNVHKYARMQKYIKYQMKSTYYYIWTIKYSFTFDL